MITNIYKNTESSDEQLCVDINEILYKILNQIYNFNQIITVREIKDIKKISNTINSKTSIYIDISNYAGSARSVLRRLNLEAFVNINTTIVTVIPSSLLKFVSNNCSNISVEYVPSTLVLADTEIELEQELSIITFNPKEGDSYER